MIEMSPINNKKSFSNSFQEEGTKKAVLNKIKEVDSAAFQSQKTSEGQEFRTPWVNKEPCADKRRRETANSADLVWFKSEVERSGNAEEGFWQR